MSGTRFWLLCAMALAVGGFTGLRSVETVLEYLFQNPRESSVAVNNGPWRTYEGLGRSDLQPMMKAMVAHIGLGALTSDEAIYWVSTRDQSGELLGGTKSYEVKFLAEPLNEPGGFWSLSLYGEDHFFVENEAGINSLAERSGLIKNEDGSFSVIVSSDKPKGAVNWLPSPEDGGFSLTLRYYIPKQVMIENPHSVPLPIIQKL